MKAKDKLRIDWSKREGDLMFHYPLGSGTSADGHFLANKFDKEFTDSLIRRGYDLTTLRFSIEPQAGNENFASQRETS